jgi:hypothetical protein
VKPGLHTSQLAPPTVVMVHSHRVVLRLQRPWPLHISEDSRSPGQAVIARLGLVMSRRLLLHTVSLSTEMRSGLLP